MEHPRETSWENYTHKLGLSISSPGKKTKEKNGTRERVNTSIRNTRKSSPKLAGRAG